MATATMATATATASMTKKETKKKETKKETKKSKRSPGARRRGSVVVKVTATSPEHPIKVEKAKNKFLSLLKKNRTAAGVRTTSNGESAAATGSTATGSTGSSAMADVVELARVAAVNQARQAVAAARAQLERVRQDEVARGKM